MPPRRIPNLAPRFPSRRRFLRQCAAGACFVIPLFRNGSFGQPVLAPGPGFIEVARQAGLAAFRDTCGSMTKNYLVETMGSGVGLFDYNNDGLLDVLLVNGSTFEALANPRLPRPSSRLFRNNGNGTFTDVTEDSGLINEGWGMGVTIGDYDNDSHRDVFITNFGTNALFHNNGNGTFTNDRRFSPSPDFRKTSFALCWNRRSGRQKDPGARHCRSRTIPRWWTTPEPRHRLVR